jgi:hypothetical protein
MSNNAELLNVLYNTEAAYAENVATFGAALPLIDQVDLSGLSREKQMVNFTRQFSHEGYQDVLMPYIGKSVKLTGRLTGLGATAVGAVPSSEMVTFLGLLVGTAVTGLATGTTLTGGTAAVPTTTVASGVLAGGLVHGGAVGDGRVGGQWLPVNTHATNNLTLLLAAPTAPNNGDVLFSSRLVHPNESPGVAEALASFRLEVLTANGHFILRGCSMLDFKISGVSPGELPQWEATIGVAHVVTTSATFPNATVAQKHASTPVANGSFAWNAFGTTTRLIETARSVAIELGDTGECLVGTAGAASFEGQVYQACRRKPGRTTIEIVVDAEATGTHSWRDRANLDPNTAPFYHAVYSLSCADGRAVGIYFPRLKLVNEPIQINEGGFNRTRVMFEALANTAGATEIARSAWRMGFA